MITILRGFTTSAVIALTLATGARSQDAEYRPMVATLRGNDPVAGDTSLTLYLLLWSTLIASPDGLSGHMQFSESNRPETHTEALSLGNLRSSDVVVWGSAEEYFDDVVVEAHVSVTGERHASWSVTSNGVNFKVPLPSRFDLSSFVLPLEVVTKFEKFDRVPVYRSKEASSQIGTLKYDVHVLEFDSKTSLISAPSFALVELPSGMKGYVPLPQLNGADYPNVVSLAGGIIYLQRGEFENALLIFNELLDLPLRQTDRRDVLLLRGRAKELLGRSGLDDFKRALAINPFFPAAIEHVVAGTLSKNNNVSEEDQRSMAVEIVKENLFYLPKESVFSKLVRE